MSDLSNFGMSKKDKKRFIIAQNRERGKMPEAMAGLVLGGVGKEVIRTGKGHDFKVRDTTGKVTKTKYFEFKSSRKAPLTKLQKKTKKKGRYEVLRFGI